MAEQRRTRPQAPQGRVHTCNLNRAGICLVQEQYTNSHPGSEHPGSEEITEMATL